MLFIDKNKDSSLEPLYELANNSKEALQILLSYFYNVSFDSRSLCSNSSVKISKRRNNKGYFVNDFGSITDLKNIDFKGILHTKFKGNKVEQTKLLNMCLGTNLCANLTTNAQQNYKANKAKKEPKTTEISAKYNYTIAVWDSVQGQIVQDYFLSKTGANLDILKMYNIYSLESKKESGSNHTIFTYTPKNFGFGWDVEKRKKYKFPNASKEYRYDQKPYLENSYIFGFEQLPKQCKNIIICGGETDCICINTHLNKFDIYAICLMSESDTNTMFIELANELKKRCECVYVLYDNDKIGIDCGKELAINFNFTYIDFEQSFLQFQVQNFEQCKHISEKLVNETYEYSYQKNIEKEIITITIKDICNVFGALGGDMLTSFIQFCIATNTTILSVKTDLFSIAVPFVQRLEFEQYLGVDKATQSNNINPLEFIKTFIYLNKKSIIQAPAGAGKSTILQEFCSNGKDCENFVKIMLGYEKTVIVVPLTSIALQLCTEFNRVFAKLKMTRKCEYLQSGDSHFDTENTLNSSIIICVYDSLHKLENQLKDCFIVVDEFHQLVNDYSYRQKANLSVFNAMSVCERVLLLSATPNYYFCSNLEPELSYKLLVCEQQICNKIGVGIVEYDNATTLEIAAYIVQNADIKSTTLVVRNNKNDLSILEKYCLEVKKSYKCFFSGRGGGHKEKDTDFDSIMKNSNTTKKYDILAYTSLLEAGVSFKFDVSQICILDVKVASKIVQLATRARYLFEKNINAHLTVRIFKKKQKESKKENAFNSQLTAIERFNELKNEAIELAALANSIESGKESFTTKQDIISKILILKNNIYCVNILYILHTLFNQETHEATEKQLIDRIIRFDKNRFYALEKETIESFNKTDFSEQIQANKATHEQSNEAYLQLLSVNPKQTINAALMLSKSNEFRDSVKSTLKITHLTKNEKLETKEFISQNIVAFQSNLQQKSISLICKKINLQKATFIDAVAIVTSENLNHTRKELNISSWEARIKMYKQDCKKIAENSTYKHRLDAVNQIECFRVLAVCKKINKILDNYKQGKSTNEFTTKELTNLVNSIALPKCPKNKKIAEINEKNILDFLVNFYDLERTQPRKNDNRIYLYHILNLKK